ncbi:uncharacterized protein LOC122296675 [Carya illinoinensis]|uniref:uncharacterized protein LOC122296675 n=1 Tax=Carya illinoinensis TaxID=32201 RepID=UPI001C71E591|nr:uncharacterized protein LOC122296675 [Carya illinoinensis]
MPVPNKIKIFDWRACKDGLPTKTNLLSKHVPIDGTCSFCNEKEEGACHALVGCKFLGETWLKVLPRLDIGASSNVFYMALKFCMAKLWDNLSIFFTVAWGIWYKRNKFFHDQIVVSPHNATEHALSLLKNYKVVYKKNRRQVQDFYQWKVPQEDFLKLNVDGSLCVEARKAGARAILRDRTRRTLLAASILESDVEEVEHIELLVIFRGLQLCAGMRIHHIQVESDCLMVIEALNQESMSNSLYGEIYHEIKQLSSLFGECLFTHVYREANMTAHLLAQCGRQVESITTWWDCIPDFLSQI